MKIIYTLLGVALFFLFACSSKPAESNLTVITDLGQLPTLKKAIYQTPTGEQFVMSYEKSSEFEQDDLVLSAGSNKSFVAAKDNKNCDATGCPDNCNFDGKRRASAKTVISKGEEKTYKNVTEFLSKFADKNPDVDMPTQINGSDERIPLEDFNATITKAYLFCYAKETDEDYHLVIGTLSDKNDPKNRFMIVEISGLPEKTGVTRTVLTKAQNNFFSIVGSKVCVSGYFWFGDGNDPIPITVSGSIYWDTEHWSTKNNAIGKHGPESLSKKLTTVWEIHPITYIKKL